MAVKLEINEIISINKYCRSCLSENAELNLFKCSDDELRVNLCEIFETCTNIDLDPNDNDMPHSLCYECFEKFKISYTLKIQCIEIDHQLKLRLSKTQNNIYFRSVKKINPYSKIVDTNDCSDENFHQNDETKYDSPNDLESNYENLEFLDVNDLDNNVEDSDDNLVSAKIEIQCNVCFEIFDDETSIKQHICNTIKEDSKLNLIIFISITNIF